MKLRSIRLVLVEPRLAANLAHCARVAANFGVEDITVVDPRCAWPPQDDAEAARIAGSASAESLARFKRVATLPQALVDRVRAVAFTRRTGEGRELEWDPARLVASIAERGGEPLALVFGNEEFGLSATDVALCSDACRIPTDEDGVASMNLSHAVAVVLAQLYAGAAPKVAIPEREPATRGEIDVALAELARVIELIGMRDANNPDRHPRRARGILDRAGADKRDIAWIRGVLSKIQVALGAKSRGRPTPPV